MRNRPLYSAAILLAATGTCVAAATSHKLVRTYLDSGNPGTAMVDGLNLVTATAVVCPKDDSTCTLALSAMDQVCGGGIGTPFQIIVTVDGTQVDAGEWVANNAPSESSNCGGGSWADNYAVSTGKHQVELYTDWSVGTGGLTQGQWSINYAVTTP